MVVIVNKNTGIIEGFYDSPAERPNWFSDQKYSNEDMYTHIVAPDGITIDEIEIENNDGNITLVTIVLSNLKEDKIKEIRKQRNELLKKTDEKWIEAFSKKEYRTPIENDKDILRDLMATVQQEVNSMTEESQIEEYDPISSLELNNNYGDE